MLEPRVADDFMNTPIAWLEWTGLHMSPWKIIGLTGALMFGGRWLVQFLASRKHGKPVIPRAVLVHEPGRQRDDPELLPVLGQAGLGGVIQNLFPAFTAAYSLYLDIRHRGWHRDKAGH